MKTTVIYHRSDYDGIFCREIARKFLPDAELIGWDYGDPALEFPHESEEVYVLDLSPACFWEAPLRQEWGSKLIWIDHHKSAIDKYPKEIRGYRIDGVAACRLAWQYFSPTSRNQQTFALPTDVQFKNREVSEPLAVRLAGEYDVWDHRDNDADVAFQFGLDAQFSLAWDSLLSMQKPYQEYAQSIIDDGRAAMQCYRTRDAEVMRSRSFLCDFEGLKFLCLNTARCNSNTFNERDKLETGHDALLAFYWTGKDWSVSMYHAAHRKDLDLSAIATRNGGGGHRGACGFRATNLSFVS